MQSWVAFERVLERGIHSNPEFRDRLAGRPLRSNERSLSDEAIAAKLREYGIEADRAWLGARIERALSAQEIVEALPPGKMLIAPWFEPDTPWTCLSVLWERWFPSTPSFETLDDRIVDGYGLAESKRPGAACERSLDAWKDVKQLLAKARLRSLEELDERFQGSHFLTNWIQDLEEELWRAAGEDRRYLGVRIEFCEETLAAFAGGSSLTVENRRRALAETYFEAGDSEKAEALFRQWLGADPRWGWGWINWSDCFRFLRADARDPSRSEKILRDALAVPNLRDRADVLDRLASLLDEQGRPEEAKDVWAELRALRSAASPVESSANRTLQVPVVPVSRPKVGRNEPCPCGSGKKYKKCCGVE